MKTTSRSCPVAARTLLRLAALGLALLLGISDLDAHTNAGSASTPGDTIKVDKEAIVDLDAIRSKLEYPPVARRAGIEGDVVLRLLIGTDGTVQQYIVLKSTHEAFTETAVQTVLQSTCTPAMLNGEPVEMWVTVPISFRFRDGSSSSPKKITPFDDLVNALEISVAHNPRLASAVYNRGLVFYLIGRTEESEKDYAIARQLEQSGQWKPYSEAGPEDLMQIRISINNPGALVARARLLAIYSPDHAITDYGTIISAHPEYMPAYEERANLYYSTGKYQEALADAGVLLGSGTSDTLAYSLLGKSCYELGRYGEALEHLTIATQLQPDDAPLSYAKAISMFLTDKPYDDVEDAFEKARWTDDENDKIRTWAAGILQNIAKQNFRTDEAKLLLQEVFDIE